MKNKFYYAQKLKELGYIQATLDYCFPTNHDEPGYTEVITVWMHKDEVNLESYKMYFEAKVEAPISYEEAKNFSSNPKLVYEAHLKYGPLFRCSFKTRVEEALLAKNNKIKYVISFQLDKTLLYCKYIKGAIYNTREEAEQMAKYYQDKLLNLSNAKKKELFSRNKRKREYLNLEELCQIESVAC